VDAGRDTAVLIHKLRRAITTHAPDSVSLPNMPTRGYKLVITE